MGLTAKVNNFSEPIPGSAEISPQNLEVCHETQCESQIFIMCSKMLLFLQHLRNVIMFSSKAAQTSQTVFSCYKSLCGKKNT